MNYYPKHVLIVGAGVSGLSSAYALRERGYDVTIIAEKIANATTSAVAGALWELPPAVCGYPQMLTMEDILRDQRLSIETYDYFTKLADRNDAGVTIRPVNFYSKTAMSSCPLERQKIRIAEKNLFNFRHDSKIINENGIDSELYKDAYCYHTPIIDTDVYLNWLLNQVCSNPQSRIVTTRVDGSISAISEKLLDEYSADLIVNCSGLGSIQLADDPTVYGARGGLVYVDNSGKYSKQVVQAHCTSLSEIGMEQGFFIFILPRGQNRLVLGGVAEIGKYDVDVTSNNYTPYKEILESCQKFLPDLNNIRIIDQQPLRVGVRPFRERGIRLERDPKHRVIHNYGHGGAGVLLSWGCAQEVCKLVGEQHL